MIEKQEKYFEEDIDDDFCLTQKYNEPILKAPHGFIRAWAEFYSSDEPDKESEEIGETEIRIEQKSNMKPLTEYVIIKTIGPMESDGKIWTVFAEKNQISDLDKSMSLEHHGITMSDPEYKSYIDLDLDSFFDIFRIREGKRNDRIRSQN